MRTPAVTSYRRLWELSPAKRRELAAVMACDSGEHRYDKLASWLDKDFATLDHANRAYIVAELDEVIVGFVRLWHSPHIDEWVIDGIVVDPAHRKTGVGYGLLRRALDLATTSGASSVVAHVRRGNVSSITIVEKAGFRRETTDYLNSYGEPRSGRGWQYRLHLPSSTVKEGTDTG